MSLKVENISFAYRKGPVILERVSLDMKAGTLTALVGQNGSGKSTLLKCVNGILTPRGGRLSWEGLNLLALSPIERSRIMSYVPQAIPESMSFRVFDVVLMGRRPYANWIRWGVRASDRQRVFSILERLGLDEICFRNYSELSGGQQQKVLIARALVQEPRLLIMDEPTSNLDLRHQQDILTLLKKTASETGISVLLSAHDLNLVMNYADRLEMLKDGRILHSGPVDDVLTSENIREIFDVDTHVGHYKGTPFVLLNRDNEEP